jgi:hypothetical protein
MTARKTVDLLARRRPAAGRLRANGAERRMRKRKGARQADAPRGGAAKRRRP